MYDSVYVSEKWEQFPIPYPTTTTKVLTLKAAPNMYNFADLGKKMHLLEFTLMKHSSKKNRVL